MKLQMIVTPTYTQQVRGYSLGGYPLAKGLMCFSLRKELIWSRNPDSFSLSHRVRNVILLKVGFVIISANLHFDRYPL
jgi:hypothetical protein